MKKPFQKAGLAIVALLVIIIVLRIVSKGRGEEAESIADIQKRQGVPVRVQTVQPDTLVRTLSFSGTIEGEEQSIIVARLMETVVSIPVRVGARVSRGQLIARLGETNPQAAYRQAESVLGNAKLNLERMEALYKQGAVSRQTLDQAQLQYDMARSGFAASRDLVELRSPVAGEVVRVHVEPGDVVSPGTPIATVAASRQVQVQLYASPEERQLIQAGQPARIHPSLADPSWIPGLVEKVDDAADPETRLFEVTVTTANPESPLRPGVLTNVEVVVEQQPGVLAIHREALLGGAGEAAQVFVVDTEGRAQLRTVEVGMTAGERVEIRTGLVPGDRVVVFGQNRLTEGDPVRIIEA